jgi:hypothetical protein
VVPGIEEEDGNRRIEFNGQIGEQDIFCLKAASQAYVSTSGDLSRQKRAYRVQPYCNIILNPIESIHQCSAFSW